MPSIPDDQWPADDPAIAAFAEDLRIIAAGPAPAPRPSLIAAMRQGTVPFESPAAGRSKRMLTKTFVGGLAAKMALGMGVAAASVTMAGATGVLPEPAQDVVASVVAAATPFELPDPGVNLQVGDPSSSTSSSSTSTTLDDDATADAAERKANHGLCVSTAAKDKVATEGADPNSHGKTVSSIARTDCGKEDKGPSTTTTTPTTTTPTTIGSSSAASGSSTSTTVASKNSGNSGNSNGNSGNGGKGNSGKN